MYNPTHFFRHVYIKDMSAMTQADVICMNIKKDSGQHIKAPQ